MKLLVAGLGFLGLAGCASLSDDARFSKVEQAVKERTGAETKWARSDDEAKTVRGRVKELLAKPLGPTEAVQIALLNNRGLQATYAELGIAEADVVQAGRCAIRSSPSRACAGATRSRSSARCSSTSWACSRCRFRTASESAWSDPEAGRRRSDRVAQDARTAWFRAVAAQETAAYMAQVKEAAEASAELARRMAAAGNFSKLDHAREQVFYAEATAQLARTRHAALAERERLTQLMGLWGEDLAFRCLSGCPICPSGARSRGSRGAGARAASRRAGRAKEAETRRSRSASRGPRDSSTCSSSATQQQRNRPAAPDGLRNRDRAAHLRLGRRAASRARNDTYMQAVNRAAETAVDGAVRGTRGLRAYRTAYDLAKHYRDEIVPLRKRISEENVLRYNGMLIGVFELLADAREQIASVNAYIEALRDFWMAETDLQLALTGRSPGGMRPALRAAAAPRPRPAGGRQ